ncbi:predicted protein [Verticillium alfalfae VaMs.102]|uniref:Predicted protein n=1 Tax=Verticillium alfalfae (strain VaMs.102 / ATCC MYA-4576 / FGSC 10136) TaxID=526221 RepID=C9SCZ7_VERA1|nr:predicted protein [Verticillium alfalfae VaMs.102]EEY16962.1 predicted protein [Verticillium alfalfae VaMs.102]
MPLPWTKAVCGGVPSGERATLQTPAQILAEPMFLDVVLSMPPPPINGSRKRMVKRLLPAVIGALDDTLKGRRLATARVVLHRSGATMNDVQSQPAPGKVRQADPSMETPIDAPAGLLGYLRERGSNGGGGWAVGGWQPLEAGKLASLAVVQGVMQ